MVEFRHTRRGCAWSDRGLRLCPAAIGQHQTGMLALAESPPFRQYVIALNQSHVSYEYKG
jgi:hypothetical protein